MNRIFSNLHVSVADTNSKQLEFSYLQKKNPTVLIYKSIKMVKGKETDNYPAHPIKKCCSTCNFPNQ